MYKPNQRQVAVEILAEAGWVSGTLHVPAISSLVAFLNKKAEFMPLTDVPVEGPEPVDFLALRRQAVLLLVPAPEDIAAHACPATGTLEVARLRCMFPEGQVDGTIQLLGGQRVSDFLETSPGFILLSDCSFVADGKAEEAHYVIVNTAHVLAVADLSRLRHARSVRTAAATADAALSRV